MSVPRFFVDAELHPEGEFVLNEGTAHHVAHSLRLRKNDKIILIDPKGKEYSCKIQNIERKRVEVKIEGQLLSNTESPIHVALGISLINTSKLDTIIRHVTELGVSEIIPFQSRRSQLKCHHVEKRKKRWEEIVKNACQQSGRTRIPVVSGAVPFGEVIERDFPLKLISWEKEKGGTLRGIYEAHKKAGRIILLVGPEGGFTEEEFKQATEKAFLPFSLGPRILRCETAAIASVALVQHYWGDLGIFS